MNSSFKKKLQHSIELLKKSEELALRYKKDGFFLAFSGGKDSQALYHVAVLAGVKFKAHYSLTTLDPPEVVRFIKSEYPDVVIDRPALTFSQLCVKKKMLPTRIIRFCCAELKETQGANTVTLTGVRKAESVNRSKRKEMERVSSSKKRHISGNYEAVNDQFTREREVEGVQCIKGKDKIIVNPIIEWTEKDVWYFLDEVVKVKHCSLYDEGFSRIGCLFCPMSNIKTISKEIRRYPKYYDLMIRTIRKIRESGGMEIFQGLTDEDVFDWWKSKQNKKSWLANKRHQTEIDFARPELKESEDENSSRYS